MKIAVIGSGPRAAAISTLLTGGGYDVTLADDSMGGAVPYDAATGRDVVIFSAPRMEMDDLVNKVGRILPETIVIDAMEGPSASGGGAEMLAKQLDSHRVVRASILRPEPNANILLAADDPDAMTVVEEIFRKCGCVTTDRGTLANAAEIEPSRAGVAV
jgi:predicted dinucleotide-binding enzyme